MVSVRLTDRPCGELLALLYRRCVGRVGVPLGGAGFDKPARDRALVGCVRVCGFRHPHTPISCGLGKDNTPYLVQSRIAQ